MDCYSVRMRGNEATFAHVIAPVATGPLFFVVRLTSSPVEEREPATREKKLLVATNARFSARFVCVMHVHSDLQIASSVFTWRWRLRYSSSSKARCLTFAHGARYSCHTRTSVLVLSQGA